jgi:hypothetical protein
LLVFIENKICTTIKPAFFVLGFIKICQLLVVVKVQRNTVKQTCLLKLPLNKGFTVPILILMGICLLGVKVNTLVKNRVKSSVV